MKSFSLTLALLIELSGAVAQPTFMKLYDGGGTAQLNINELNSGNLRVGISPQSGTSLMDPAGNILQSSNYALDTFLVLQSVRRYTDNEFYFIGNYNKDSCVFNGTNGLTINPAIGKMDSMGNVLSVYHYRFEGGCANIAGDIAIGNAGSVFAWGRDDWFHALKIHADGSVLWAKHFDRHGGFRFIKELPGGDVIAGINMDTAGVVVARLDPNGNFLWCKSYLRPGGIVMDCLIESDDAFVITGFTDSTTINFFTPLPPDYHPKLFMLKLNGTGDVQWCKGYDSAPNLWFTRQTVRIQETQDNKYVLLATLGVENYNQGFRPILVQTDSNGDTLWTRSNGRTNYSYESGALLLYSDGGILYNGVIYGNLPGNSSGMPFLFKTDAQGHLPCFERHHPIQVTDLFPTDSSFTLTSVDGAEARAAFVTDYTYPPITVYDGCSFTTNIPPWQRTTRKMSVRPNPNTGRFTVQFADPLMAQSYYSVYDAMGQLLYQRPLPQGQQTQEVDLSRYSTGTYVIKFTSPEGTCYERVVVE